MICFSPTMQMAKPGVQPESECWEEKYTIRSPKPHPPAQASRHAMTTLQPRCRNQAPHPLCRHQLLMMVAHPPPPPPPPAPRLYASLKGLHRPQPAAACPSAYVAWACPGSRCLQCVVTSQQWLHTRMMMNGWMHGWMLFNLMMPQSCNTTQVFQRQCAPPLPNEATYPALPL
jgi:hypothetical protein